MLRLGNQQPSSLTGEGSTTRAKARTLKRVEKREILKIINEISQEISNKI